MSDAHELGPHAYETILRARARALARTDQGGRDEVRRIEVLIVAVGRGRYALRLDGLGRVAPMSELCALPGAPEFVAGVAQIDGEILTVVELGRLLGQPAGTPAVALVMHTDQGNLALGVDAYEGVEAAALGEVAAGAEVEGERGQYVERVLAGGVGLLAVQRLLRDLLLDEPMRSDRSKA